MIGLQFSRTVVCLVVFLIQPGFSGAEIGDDYIIGGRNVARGEQPYAVQIWFGGSFKCSGSLIGRKFAVTAGHCTKYLSPSAITVYVGSITVSAGQPNRKAYTVSRIYTHTDSQVDVSILKLSRRVRLNEDVKVVQLGCTVPGFEVVGHVSGWGQTVPDRNDGTHSDVLQTVAVRTYPHTNCIGENLHPKDFELCLGLHDATTYTNACYGDSGGPFVVGDKLVGVVSGGTTLCPSDTRYALYTSVHHICDWMVKTLGCSIEGGQWSDFLNTPVTTSGDEELISNSCPGSHVACVRCQKASCTGVSTTCQSTQKYRCTANKGLVCLNSKQPSGCTCCDFRMKAKCYP